MTEVLERNATAPAVKSGTPAASPEAPRAPKLLDQMRDRIRAALAGGPAEGMTADAIAIAGMLGARDKGTP